MSDTASQPCCAHRRVEYRTEDVAVTEEQASYFAARSDPASPHAPPRAGSKLTRGWWECASGCGTRFVPVPLSQTEHEAPVPSTPAPVAWMEAAAARILNGLFHELADHSSPDRDRIAKRYAELRSVTNFSDAARTARHELIVSILSELARVSPSEGSAPDTPTDVREECARVCESRGRSLRESGQHGEANEAHKCAMAIRAHGFSDSFRPVPPSAPAPQEEAEPVERPRDTRTDAPATDARGFGIFCDFTDGRNARVRVKQSSAAHTPHLWIFVEGGNYERVNDGSAHLTLDEAALVRDALDAGIAFLAAVSDTPDTGEGTEDTKLSRVSSSPPEGEDTQRLDWWQSQRTNALAPVMDAQGWRLHEADHLRPLAVPFRRTLREAIDDARTAIPPKESTEGQ